MARRRLLPLLLLVSALLFATQASATPNAADASSSSRDSGNSTSNNATTTVSSCELCRDRGQCDQAYRGSAGIFCGSAARERTACCCPADGVCLRAASGCACGAKSPPQSASVKDQQGKGSVFGGSKIAWTVLTALVLCALIAVYLYTTREDRSYHYREPRRRPATTTTTRTTQQPMPAQPATSLPPSSSSGSKPMGEAPHGLTEGA